jgi:ABC-type glycerol-3-phosphate transport system substrate-binding protein
MTSTFKALSALAVLVGVMLLVGCGGDDGESASSETAAGDDAAAIEETVKGWLLEGGCERMTDEFLEAQTFLSDPEEACETFETGFTAPSYGEDDIVVSDIEVDGTKGSATVGDETSGIESRYELVNEDGTWKIDSADLL